MFNFITFFSVNLPSSLSFSKCLVTAVNCGAPDKCSCGGQQIELTGEIEEKIKPYYTEFTFGKMLNSKEELEKVKSI